MKTVMVNQLLNDLYAYLNSKESRTEQEEMLRMRLDGELPYFIISRIHRDDVQAKGFDISQVTDAQMSQLSSKMSDDYCNQLFWESMDIIAEDYIPREYCPVCNEKMDQYKGEYFECDECSHRWHSDKFIHISSDVVHKVREKGIGYVCIDPRCPCSQYIPVSQHSNYFDQAFSMDMIYRLVTIEDEKTLDKLINAGYRIDIPTHAVINDYGNNLFWVSVKPIYENEQ